MTPRRKVLAAALVLLVVLPAVLAACPLCKDALEDKTTGVPNELGRGFYYSILLMVSAPFVVLSGLLLRIHLLRKRRRAAEPAAAEEPLVAAPAAARLLPEPRGARF
ncbi:MAG TPA: hypothetical protein VEG84_07810 [Thermoanaerobaculia bacterium]|nr:hypothetical protein [Thermoanaerobaculia bacterium]